MTEDNFMGKMAFNGSGEGVFEFPVFTALVPGKYYLVMQYVVYSTRSYIYPKVLTLDGIALGSANLSLDKNEIAVSETAQAYYSKSGEGGLRAAFADVIAPVAGKYYLVFQYVPSASRSYIYPQILLLDSSVLHSVTLDISETRLGPGETASSVVNGFYEGGREADLSFADITYTSLDPSVADIDAQGRITAYSAGTADITAVIKLGDITRTDTKTVNVSGDYTLDSVTLTSLCDLTVSAKQQLYLTGNLRNGDTIYIPSNDASFTLSGTNPEGAAVLRENGIVEGFLPGTADIKASVSCRGKQFETSVLSLTVNEQVPATSNARFDFKGSVNGADTRKILVK
ncbi:MAG: hypothetical protein GX541_03980 [Clostridiales bacterium]|nr:hypothetical protein [Clostridiales bacterium]